MKLTGNTILVTGGGSGIGRAFAEALHKRGNEVIIAGRRLERLQSVVEANPGMHALQLDIQDPASIAAATDKLTCEHPDLNVLFNNAGVMIPDGAQGQLDEEIITSTVTTNLLGPVRLTSALIEHLKTKDDAVVAYTTSALAYVPMAMTAVYSATRAALHSYALSQRFLLKDAGVKVLEIAPPWVRTELMESQDAEPAMPLDAFIAEAMGILGADTDEIIVKAAHAFRANPGVNEHPLIEGFNAQITEYFAKQQQAA